MLADELLGACVLCRSGCLPLPQPPRGSALVEGADVAFVHHQHAASSSLVSAGSTEPLKGR